MNRRFNFSDHKNTLHYCLIIVLYLAGLSTKCYASGSLLFEGDKHSENPMGFRRYQMQCTISDYVAHITFKSLTIFDL